MFWADDPEGPREIGLPCTVAAGVAMATWRGGREQLTRARKQLSVRSAAAEPGAATGGRLRDLHDFDARRTGLPATLNPVPVRVDVASVRYNKNNIIIISTLSHPPIGTYVHLYRLTTTNIRFMH